MYKLIDIEKDEVIATVYSDNVPKIDLFLPREGELVYFTSMPNPWFVERVVHQVFGVGKSFYQLSYVYVRHMTAEETAQEAVFNVSLAQQAYQKFCLQHPDTLPSITEELMQGE